MKRLIGLGALALAFQCAAKHPSVYFTEADLPALREKAKNVAWARELAQKWHREVDQAVAKHAADPSFAPSRLQMHWAEGRRYTRFWTEGNYIARREGNAKYPTVRLAYARTWGECAYRSVSWEKNPPYAGDEGVFLSDKPTRFPGDLVPLAESGMAAELINEKLLDMAYKSAILYSLERDARYAKFAADIVWTIVRGAAQQEEVNPGKVDNCGFLSWETLGDTRRYWTVPLIWDMLHGYFNETYFKSAEFRCGIPGEAWCPGHPEGEEWAERQFGIFFKKFIDNKLMRGGGLLGNWNMNEQLSAMLCALAMEPDSKYADGKGRKHYVKAIVKGPTTERHGAYLDVLRANIDPKTGLWPEAPGGYGQGTICQLVKYGFIYWKNGLDILSRDPLLEKASTSTLRMLHSNGYVTNIGDSTYSKMWSEQLELLLAYESAKGDSGKAARYASLLKFLGKRELKSDIAFFFFLPELPDPGAAPALSRASYAPLYPVVLERNPSTDGAPEDGLSFSLAGASLEMGHRHANGISLELCAGGEIFAPDPGAGSNYWSKDNSEYYHNVAAHNTCIPCGLPADDKKPLDFRVVAAEPELVPGEDAFETNSRHRQYVTVEGEFKSGDTTSKQQRTVAIVRSGRKTGYFLDIFRSKVGEGLRGEERHDYLLHLMGERISTLEGGESGASFNSASGFGYSYFTHLGSYDAAKGWVGEVKYSEKLSAKVFVPASEGDVFLLEGPKVFRHYDKRLKEMPCPAIALRRKGEAWNRPFAAVIEPCRDGEGVIGSVSERLLPSGTLEIAVKYSLPGRKDVISVFADGTLKIDAFSGNRKINSYPSR